MRQLKPSLKKKFWQVLGGRKGVSEAIIKLIKEFDHNPTYKEAIALAGKMRLLAEIAEVDPYWNEKMKTGYYTMLEKLEYQVEEGL